MRVDDENLNNIVNSLQLTDEFTKEVYKQQNKKETLKNDLECLIKDNTQKKIQNHIGITKEEVTLNKHILASMLTSNGSPVKRRKDNSPNKKSVIEEMLPIVNRK